jgi:hypothetical protein
MRSELAGMLTRPGHCEQAEQEYWDVLTAEIRVLGPDYPSIPITQDSLTEIERRDRSASGRPTDYE